MAEILCVTWDGGGNVPPMLLLARELVARGHVVRFLGHERQRLPLQGFELTPWTWRHDWSSLVDHSPLAVVSSFSERGIADDLAAELRRRPVDLVVVDCLLIPALQHCAGTGQRYVSLEHLFDGYLRKEWMTVCGNLARLRRRDPVRAWNGADVCLVATAASLDSSGHRPVADNQRFTGPILAPPAPHDLDAHAPGVLVSLSSTRFPGMTEALQRILDATAGLDARVVVTTGLAVDQVDLRFADNHEVHAFVDHDDLMPQVSLVLGHGGHATTMRALAHDLPVVVMPMHPMLDQPLVGRAVAAAGAGAVLAKRARPVRIGEVVERYVGAGPHRAAAALLGEEIRSMNGLRRSADLVESCA